jgi:hypothetical protein
MGHSELVRRHPHSRFLYVVALVLFAFVTTSGFAQAAPSQPTPDEALKELNKYPGLLPAFGQLMQKLQRDVQFPPERTHSDLLPLLLPSTVAYVSLPNYGDAAHQALTIFQQELRDNPDLRAWWTRGEMLKTGPKLESFVENFSQISGYLGDEVVICGALNGKEPDFVVLAEIRKPAAKAALQKMVLALAEKQKPGIHILDPQELATATANPQDLVVLVRPDFLVATTNLARLRAFNEHLDRGSREFVSGPFVQRILRSYENGVGVIGAVDLQKIVALMPHDPSFAGFQRSGFADVKYAVWERRKTGVLSTSQMEVSFTGPRRGAASWLGAPASLGSLDFVSQKPVFLASFVLSNPAKMLDDIQELSASDQKSMVQFAMMGQMFGINLKNDVLAQLSGEVTVELDNVPPAEPVWKAILHVKDANHLGQTLTTVLNGMHASVEQHSEGGVTYHLVRNQSAKGTNTIAFAFVDNYLVMSSSADTLAEAVRLRKSGESLGKSRRLQLATPGGNSKASALLYYDTTEIVAAQLHRANPAMAETLAQFAGANAPVTLWFYGDTDAIREASTGPGADFGAAMMGAAIAIPNLLRSRIAANEASAVAKVRTMNTAEVAYAGMYPDRGFAPDLATLGPDPSGIVKDSANHAGLLDAKLANPTCANGKWCESSGYRFTVRGRCGLGTCNDFVAVATPASGSTGTRSFCSTSDGVVRMQITGLLTTPPTVRECKMWRPLQ